MSGKPVVSVTIPSGPLFDPKTGQPTFAFIKWMQGVQGIVNTFDTQGNITPGAIPAPTATTLGGVESAGPIDKEWISAIGTDGAPVLKQPAFSDLSGAASPSQVPAISALNGTVAAGQIPQLSQLAGKVIPSQVPPLSELPGSVTAGQVPALSALTGQITSGQLPAGGFSGTITTAKLTVGGTNGSMTFTDGQLTAETPAT